MASPCSEQCLRSQLVYTSSFGCSVMLLTYEWELWAFQGYWWKIVPNRGCRENKKTVKSSPQIQIKVSRDLFVSTKLELGRRSHYPDHALSILFFFYRCADVLRKCRTESYRHRRPPTLTLPCIWQLCRLLMWRLPTAATYFHSSESCPGISIKGNGHTRQHKIASTKDLESDCRGGGKCLR